MRERGPHPGLEADATICNVRSFFVHFLKAVAVAITSPIEWTEATWNPVAGCSVLSPGCTNCYAMRMAERLELMGQPKYAGLTRRSGGRAKWTGRVNVDAASLGHPRRWARGRRIFVNSMSDLFHDDVPASFVRAVFDVMVETPRHTYQLLTKRADRLAAMAADLPWPAHVWMGVSVETQDYVARIDHLRRVPAAVRFLSIEPLLGPVESLDLAGIHWVIVGGESGPQARAMQSDWVRPIRDACVTAGVAFHFKQWGGTNKKRAGRLLDGRVWDEFPQP
jgi:protein gp37